MDCLDCINLKDATVQDKAILMCMERIERLESQVSYMEEKLRIHLINTIAASSYVNDIVIDIFFYLVGVTPEERIAQNCTVNVILNVLHKYMPPAKEFADPRIARMNQFIQSPKPIMQLSNHDVITHGGNGFCGEWYDISSDIKGHNIYSYLQTWTTKELEDYWEYRLKWTQWIAAAPPE